MNKMPVFGCPKENQFKFSNNEFLSHFRTMLLFYTIHSFFLQEQFYKNKSLDFGKTKIKNKLKTKPGLLSHRT